jgi:hypothetical protein
LLKKIEELEARIKLLESRPSGETHHHYHYQQPHYQPQQYPWWAQPLSVPTVWCVNDLPKTPTVTVCSPLSGSPQFGSVGPSYS